jgi:spermidine synthase
MSLKGKMPVRLTSLLSFIFFFSGFAALIYQVAWQRLLTVYYGVGAISITLIVSIYMFGMGIGALFGGFLSERVKNKIILYFIVELLIGCFGLVSLPFLNFLGRYTAGSSYLLSFIYMFLFLSIPTILMGITLPLLTKIFNGIVQNFLDSVSFLYFINTIGAACGAVFSSYVIISFFGLDTAAYFAVTINFSLAVLIFLAKYYPTVQQERKYVPDIQYNQEAILGKVAYLFVFITGFLAIGYEIAWFRVVGILVKASPYAFSSVLSVYLSGIALGSFSMNKYLKKHNVIDKKNLFFLIQLLISIYVIASFIAYYYLTKYTFFATFTRESFSVQLHPSFTMPVLHSVKEFLKYFYSLIDVFLWPVIFVFIPTILMGASFPLISSLALSERDKEGKTVGTVYFFNITGNVLGGIVTGFVLLPICGTETTLLGFSLAGVFFMLFITKVADIPLQIIKRIVLALTLVVISVIFFPQKGQLYEIMHISPGNEFESYFEEGIDGVVMTYQYKDKVWNYINGLMHGIRPAPAYYYETVEAVSYSPKIENILIIGYGTGSITEAILKMKNTGKVTLVELSHTLINNLVKMTPFKEMLADSRLELIIDDGRRYLLKSNKKYDLILIDPLRSSTAYSNNIYSQQFFELVNKRLNPGGIFMVWMDEFRVMPKTVMSVFDHVRVYNFFCLGSNMPFKENYELKKHILNSFSEQEKSRILTWYSRESKNVGDNAYIEKLVAGYPINQDWKPVVEYYLGLELRKKFIDNFGEE